MPIETIEFKGKNYPAFQATGNAARFIMPFATEVCKGVGFDIGCNRAEWSLPGSILIDPVIGDCPYDAHNLPNMQVDYIFASHVIEHLADWVGAVMHWHERLKPGGVLFLYWPAYTQEYWRPWSNRKHLNIIDPNHIIDLMLYLGYRNIKSTGVDLYDSYALIAEKI